MPDIAVQKIEEITIRHKVSVSGDDIIDLLRKDGFDIKLGASVTIHVPGGGDWSNTDLDVSLENKVEVRWTDKHTLVDGKE